MTQDVKRQFIEYSLGDEDEAAFAALEAVLELHYEKGPPESRYCAAECYDWPCPTVQAISSKLPDVPGEER